MKFSYDLNCGGIKKLKISQCLVKVLMNGPIWNSLSWILLLNFCGVRLIKYDIVYIKNIIYIWATKIKFWSTFWKVNFDLLSNDRTKFWSTLCWKEKIWSSFNWQDKILIYFLFIGQNYSLLFFPQISLSSTY